MIHPTGIDHTYLLSGDPDRLIGHIATIFPLVASPHPRDAGLRLVEAGGARFFIRPVPRADAVPSQHLAFEVDSLDEAVEHLRGCGAPSVETGECAGSAQGPYRWVSWAGPEGITFECIEKGVRIIEAVESDAPALLTLQKLAFLGQAQLYGDYSLPPLRQTLEELRYELRSGIALKALIGAGLAGSVRAMESGGTCFISRLIVHPDRQNRGLGRRLMKEIEARFPAAERFELFTGFRSERNINLYRSLGYRVFKTVAVRDDFSLVYMEKTGGGNRSGERM